MVWWSFLAASRFLHYAVHGKTVNCFGRNDGFVLGLEEMGNSEGEIHRDLVTALFAVRLRTGFGRNDEGN